MISGILVAVEDRSQADHRGALLGPHPEILARAHPQLAQAVAPGELAQASGERARLLRVFREGRHRHQPDDVRVEAEEVLQLALRDAGLRLLAGEVDLDERRDRQPARGRLAGQRMAELTELVDNRRLAALQVTDEVPAEELPVERVLRLEVLCAVLADDL